MSPTCPACGGDMFGALTCPCWGEPTLPVHVTQYFGEQIASLRAELAAERARREAAEDLLGRALCSLDTGAKEAWTDVDLDRRIDAFLAHPEPVAGEEEG